jgi:succinate dehydrogenase hydrophobic anchor subunit
MYYFWIVVVPTSDPKDLFMEHVTMFTAQSTGLIWVCLVEYHVAFLVLWMFGAEEQDVTSWTQAMEWVYLLALAQKGASVGCDFRSGETLV